MQVENTIFVELSSDIKTLLYENEFDVVDLLRAEGLQVNHGINQITPEEMP